MTDTPATHIAGQGRLDALVTEIATSFMSASSSSLVDTLTDALRVLSEFFDVNVSFLRHNDLERDVSVLVAEWPPRRDVPHPDPLGEVPFEADPVFAASKTIDAPFVMRLTAPDDAYQEQMEAGSGVDQVSTAMVPLLAGGTTEGVLGFVKFGDRAWDVAETNALQAIASLMVHLEARVAAENRLTFQALHDDLTSLPNRRAALADLARRLDDDRDITAVLLFDLDQFKAMNDALGHAAGDRVLVSVGERLTDGVRPEDTVARLAGDEFVVLFNSRTSLLGALAAAERLLACVSEPIEIAGHQVVRTASIGVAVGRPGAVTADELMAEADVALRAAKSAGGNRPVLFDASLRALARERSEIELQLRDALAGGQLRLYYQPEVDMRTGELLGVEALVRWEHPERGLLAAGTFIPIAEETGLIVELGQWVLAEACRQRAAWRQAHPWLDFTVRINMSPAQLVSRNFVRLVDECLRANELPGRFVCFEITEHAVMADIEQSLRRLHDLKKLGVTLAIDDFGTGFSSLAQLKRLPVDILKIDQTFVAGLGVDNGDLAIVDATIRLAASFGLDVVAEGIEVPEQADILRRLGCIRGQGFLLARPAPPDALVPVLRNGHVDLGGVVHPTFAALEPVQPAIAG